jgi:hypothetical protein
MKRNALEALLASGVLPGAAAFPVDVSLRGSRWVVGMVSLGLGWGILVAFGIRLGVAANASTVAYLAGLALFSGVLVWIAMQAGNVRIDAAGVRLGRLFGSASLSWESINSVEAARDLSFFAVVGDARRILINCGAVGADRRTDIANGLRARSLEYGIEIAPLSTWALLALGAKPGLGGLVGTSLIALGAILALSEDNGVGIRCSVNSEYLQRSFDTPARQGCVVLRSSAGAKHAGIQQGDLLIEVNGIPITSGTQFSSVFRAIKGSEFDFKAVRSGIVMDFQVRPAHLESFRENPTDPIFYYLRAREEASESQIDAIEDYTRTIELAPQFDLAYLYRAELYDEIGHHDSALADLQQAIGLSPSLGEAHRLFANHERRFGVLGAAHLRIRKAIDLDQCKGAFEGHNVDCNEDYYILGVLQEGYYDVEEPIATTEQAIRFWPEAPEPYCLLATLYERSRDLSKAVENARLYLSFPQVDRFPNCEPDARRIAARVTLTPAPTSVQTTKPTWPTPTADGIGDCIDFDSGTSCAP